MSGGTENSSGWETSFFQYRYLTLIFNRPGIQALFRTVRSGGADCIVVKDFSRFSRDYIELGSWIEQIFPFLGVRFISVNDHYDSACQEGVAGLEMSFSGLVGDLYSKDLSVKVKSALWAGKERGLYVSACCPFGYCRDPGDRHKLVTVEEEAVIVRRIFAMALEGMTSTAIARRLNREGVATPSEIRGRKQLKHGTGGRKQTEYEAACRKQPEDAALSGINRKEWSGPYISRLLQNQVYTGDMVYGKYEKKEVGGPSHLKPRQDWHIHRDCHEPLIDRESFAQLGRKRRDGGKHKEDSGKYKGDSGKHKEDSGKHKGDDGKHKGGSRHPLTGRLRCACCGRSLTIRRTASPWFECPGRYTGARKECIKRVDAQSLDRIVAAVLQLEIRREVSQDLLSREMRKIPEGQLQRAKEDKKLLLVKYDQLRKRRLTDYEKFVGGEITDGECRDRLKAAALGAELLKGSVMEADGKIEFWNHKLKAYDGKTQEMQELLSCLGLTGLNRNAVECFVDRIIVHDESHIEVVLSFRTGI